MAPRIAAACSSQAGSFTAARAAPDSGVAPPGASKLPTMAVWLPTVLPASISSYLMGIEQSSASMTKEGLDGFFANSLQLFLSRLQERSCALFKEEVLSAPDTVLNEC